MICVAVCVNKVGVFLSFVDRSTTYLEETLMWYLIQFVNIIPLINDRFVRVMH